MKCAEATSFARQAEEEALVAAAMREGKVLNVTGGNALNGTNSSVHNLCSKQLRITTIPIPQHWSPSDLLLHAAAELPPPDGRCPVVDTVSRHRATSDREEVNMNIIGG